jgi:hypothetical protein
MQIGRYYKVNCPDWYQDAQFLAWLNQPNTATWHTKGQWPNEYSDAFYYYSDPGDFRTDNSDLPRRMMEQLRKELGPIEVLVWITNLSTERIEGFCPNTTYLLKPEVSEAYTEEASDGLVYKYGRTTPYSGGTLTDMWIMAEDETIHPGYNNDPVPIHWKDVVHPPDVPIG